MDDGTRRLSAPAVLLCSRTGLSADGLAGFGFAVEVVDDLCDRPAAAAAALRRLGATRAVVALCGGRVHGDLAGALRRAGAEPFATATVDLSRRPAGEAAQLVAAAVARLAALPRGERGRPAISSAGMSRRGLLTLSAPMAQVEVAVVDEPACVGASRCGMCAEACAPRAIRLGSDVPAVDRDACTACGRCVPRCPAGALRLSGSSYAQVEAQLEALLPEFEGILLACRNAGASAPSGWALVELPTLGLVGPGSIVQLRARGVEVRTAPCGGPCCAGAGAVEAFAARLVHEYGPPRTNDAPPVRLREPLATADGVVRIASHDGAAVKDDASPLGLLAFDAARCTVCGACAASCPTNALRLEEGADETVLRYVPSECVACGRCVAACPEHALAVTRGADPMLLRAGRLDLIRAARESCAGCGADLPPRPMRARLRQLLPQLADAPLELCAACATALPTSGGSGGLTIVPDEHEAHATAAHERRR